MPGVMLQASEEKVSAIAQAERTVSKAGLANRLIGNLSGERDRWSTSIQVYSLKEGDFQDVMERTLALQFESSRLDESEDIKILTAMQQSADHLFGDVLLGAAFVCYAGPFTADFRRYLSNDKWVPLILAHEIPISMPITPLDVLSDVQTQVIILLPSAHLSHYVFGYSVRTRMSGSPYCRQYDISCKPS
jgi:dynein heavy chain, axonemal